MEYQTYRAMVKRLTEMSEENKVLINENKALKNEKEKMLQKRKSEDETVGAPPSKARMLKVHKWSDEDVAKALTLKCISRKAYKYVRENWGLSLPGISTLNDRIRAVKCEPGLISSALRLMKELSSTMTEQERCVVLCFDEMSIEKKYVYDNLADKIYGPHSKVQVAVIRGIFCTFKQPFFYDFDTNMTTDLLNELIMAIENAGFFVFYLTCDLAGGNRGLLNKIGISIENNTMPNPYDSQRRISVSADVPHLIKLIRNNILDHGISTPSGLVSRYPFWELVSNQSGDLRIGHKISESTLKAKGYERQKVSSASKLLSETVSKGISFLGEKGQIKSHDWKATADFTKLVDQWFDVMNSSTFNDKASRRGFKSTDYQNRVLDNMIATIKSSLVGSYKRLLPFQMGIILSCMSIRTLYQDLSSKFGIQYIYTRRLSQDVIENLFGVIRQMGQGHSHMNPVEFKFRLRSVIVGRKNVLVSSNSNTRLRGDVPCFASNISKLKNLSSPVKASKSSENQQFQCMTAPVLQDHEDFSDMQINEFNGDFYFINAVPKEEKYAMAYFRGFVAFKFRHKYPEIRCDEGAPPNNDDD